METCSHSSFWGHSLKHCPFFLLRVLVALASVLAMVPLDAQGVRLLPVKEVIGPATSNYVSRNLEEAREAGDELVILQIDTPGGLLSSTRDIISAILASEVPVATWVAPSGARAASAGVYIAYASHIVAMANATNLGSATPVQIGALPADDSLRRALLASVAGRQFPAAEGESGADQESEAEGQKEESEEKDSEKDSEKAPAKALERILEKILGKDSEKASEKDSEQEKTAMEKKIINDSVAYVRGLADLRGRNADWAESAVRDAANVTASDALDLGVIDYIAGDIKSLLDQTQGRVVLIGPAEKELTIDLDNRTVRTVEPGWQHKLISILSNPNVTSILMLLGFYGLLAEFYNPGTGVGGILGVICLLLAFYSFQVLPINYVGLALMGFGLVLMVVEALVPGFGLFALGGTVSFVLGAIFLVDTDISIYQVSLPLILGVAAVSVLFSVLLVGAAVRARNRPVVTGSGAMIGAPGVVRRDFDEHGEGWVVIGGESWRARSKSSLDAGSRVRVASVDGLTVQVEPSGPDAEAENT